jgi:hypothetical protein
MPKKTPKKKVRTVIKCRTPMEEDLGGAAFAARAALALLARHPLPDASANTWAAVSLLEVVRCSVSALAHFQRAA